MTFRSLQLTGMLLCFTFAHQQLRADIDIDVETIEEGGDELRVLTVRSDDDNAYVFCRTYANGTIRIHAFEAEYEFDHTTLYKLADTNFLLQLDRNEEVDEVMLLEEFDRLEIFTSGGHDLVRVSCDERPIFVFTNAGNDTVVADGQHVVIDGGVGNDYLLAESDGIDDTHGTCQVFGGPGDDWVEGYEFTTGQLEGGPGNDVVVSYCHAVTLGGGSGDDYLQNWADDAEATLFGDVGNDVLVGAAGVDILKGGDGDDVLIGFCPISTTVVQQLWSAGSFFPQIVLPELKAVNDGMVDLMSGGRGSDQFYSVFTEQQTRRYLKTVRRQTMIRGQLVWVTSKVRASESTTVIVAEEHVRDLDEADGDEVISTSVGRVRI